MNKESYLFDRIRWGAAIFFDFSYQSVVYPVPSGLEDGENEVVYFVFRSALCYPALCRLSADLPAFKSEQPDKGGFCQRGQL